MRGSALFAPYTTQIGNPWRCLECDLDHPINYEVGQWRILAADDVMRYSCALAIYVYGSSWNM
jgi:hypothetical protein